jgi:hypothetical protein
MSHEESNARKSKMLTGLLNKTGELTICNERGPVARDGACMRFSMLTCHHHHHFVGLVLQDGEPPVLDSALAPPLKTLTHLLPPVEGLALSVNRPTARSQEVWCLG